MTSLLSATGHTWLTARSTTLTTTPESASTDASTSATAGATGTAASVAKTPGQSARAALDAQAAAAAKAGTQVVYDLSQPGRVVDMRSLEPEELAAIANGTGASFSHDEKLWAQGELSHRVAVTLEGLDSGDPGDSRAYQMGVKALYGQMSPAVRQALGWTPQMLQSADRIIEVDERHLGKLDEKRFWEQFVEGQRKDGALRPSRVDLTI